MSFVLDSSVTLAWIYSDETTAAIQRMFEVLKTSGAWVNGIWRLEVANVLEMGVRRKRHDAAFRDATLTDLAQLPIHVDGETDHQNRCSVALFPESVQTRQNFYYAARRAK